MVEKQNETQIINGLRKGMTKEKLMKSLTAEDWKFIDKVKEAEEKKVSPEAYKFFLKSDQAVQECTSIQSQLTDTVAGILLINHEMTKSKLDISLGETKKTNAEGEPISLDELHYLNLKAESKIKQAMNTVYANLSRLYVFVGKKGFDTKIYYTEEEYNEFVQNIRQELEKTPYKLV